MSEVRHSFEHPIYQQLATGQDLNTTETILLLGQDIIELLCQRISEDAISRTESKLDSTKSVQPDSLEVSDKFLTELKKYIVALIPYMLGSLFCNAIILMERYLKQTKEPLTENNTIWLLTTCARLALELSLGTCKTAESIAYHTKNNELADEKLRSMATSASYLHAPQRKFKRFFEFNGKHQTFAEHKSASVSFLPITAEEQHKIYVRLEKFALKRIDQEKQINQHAAKLHLAEMQKFPSKFDEETDECDEEICRIITPESPGLGLEKYLTKALVSEDVSELRKQSAILLLNSIGNLPSQVPSPRIYRHSGNSPLSLFTYLDMFARYLSPPILITMLIYIDRFFQKSSPDTLNFSNVYAVIFAAINLALTKCGGGANQAGLIELYSQSKCDDDFLIPSRSSKKFDQVEELCIQLTAILRNTIQESQLLTSHDDYIKLINLLNKCVYGGPGLPGFSKDTQRCIGLHQLTSISESPSIAAEVKPTQTVHLKTLEDSHATSACDSIPMSESPLEIKAAEVKHTQTAHLKTLEDSHATSPCGSIPMSESPLEIKEETEKKLPAILHNPSKGSLTVASSLPSKTESDGAKVALDTDTTKPPSKALSVLQTLNVFAPTKKRKARIQVVKSQINKQGITSTTEVTKHKINAKIY